MLAKTRQKHKCKNPQQNISKLSSIALNFGNRKYQISKEYSLDASPNIDILNRSCDTFLVGSDQLWNPKVYAYKYYFFLDFVDAEKRKISYATSVGARHFEGTDVDKHYCSYYLNRFDSISNREDEAVQMCGEEFGISSTRSSSKMRCESMKNEERREQK